MAANDKTSLSAGLILYQVLKEAIGDKVTKIYPVVVDKAILPYVVYRRIGMDVIPTKSGRKNADTIHVTILCYAATYEGSVGLAEDVRLALEGKEYETEEGQLMRCSNLTDSEEGWENDAYLQTLSFDIKI